MFINNAGIDEYNFFALNGVFHIIDKVAMGTNDLVY